MFGAPAKSQETAGNTPRISKRSKGQSDLGEPRLLAIRSQFETETRDASPVSLGIAEVVGLSPDQGAIRPASDVVPMERSRQAYEHGRRRLGSLHAFAGTLICYHAFAASIGTSSFQWIEYRELTGRM